MLRATTHNEIMRNPVWAPHVETVRKFDQYLKDTADMGFRVSGTTEHEGIEFTVTKELEYVHRWTALYKRSVLARFYQLEAYVQESRTRVTTMLTLTTPHAYDRFGRPSKTSTATIPEAYATLKTAWRKLSAALRMTLPLQYVWIMEPHETGYPHIHVALFGRVNKHDQSRLKRLWSRYSGASVTHGAKFTERRGAQKVKSIRNYLMKYLSKSWHDTNWTTAELVFNAITWKNKWRLWGATRKVTEVMKRTAPEKTGVDWQLTEMKTRRFDTCYHPIWRQDGTHCEPEYPEPVLTRITNSNTGA